MKVTTPSENVNGQSFFFILFSKVSTRRGINFLAASKSVSGSNTANSSHRCVLGNCRYEGQT